MNEPRDAEFARLKAEADALGVVWTCTLAPVQAEGRTAEGRPWYFRARGWTWGFSVAEQVGAAVEVAVDVGLGDAPGWDREQLYEGAGPYPASHMPAADALALIRACLLDYERGLLDRVEG